MSCVRVSGFLSSIVSEMVDCLSNGDMPGRVLREGINRRVSDGVSKIMSVVHVRGIGGPQPPSPCRRG
ncbi:MAG: hypothetical protein RXQ94_09465 [Caldivirga sp.]